MLGVSLSIVNGLHVSYYFSTHGCRRVLSGCDADFDELAAAAASFWRALMSKKLAIVSSSRLLNHASGVGACNGIDRKADVG